MKYIKLFEHTYSIYDLITMPMWKATELLIYQCKKYNPDMDLVRDLFEYAVLDVNMTYFEIDALIHGIKELRRGYTLEEWDALTFGDLMGLYSSMRTIESRLRENYGEEVSLIWQRSMVKRMDREGLLGSGMRSLYRV